MVEPNEYWFSLLDSTESGAVQKKILAKAKIN